MINQLSLQNFKSWQDTGDIRLGSITGLFGTNSSGKSSILQSLLLLKQTTDSPDLAQVLNFGDTRTYVDLGTYRDVLYHGNNSVSRDVGGNGISWSVQWTLPDSLKVKNPERMDATLFSARQLSFHTEVKDLGTPKIPRIAVSDLEYTFADESHQHYLFGMKRKQGNQNEYDFISEGFDPKRKQGRPWPLPAPIKCYGFPSQVAGYYQNAGFLPDFNLAFEELFSRVYYLGPLRDYPKRQYTWGGGQPSDMGPRGERAIDALLASRDRGKSLSRGRGRGMKRFTLEEYVAWWLQELGLIHSFSVEAISADSNLYRVRVQKTADSASVLITDVGFGVSQILPVLVLCYYVPEGSTILLEQPEIHLHPSVQAGLADVFIDAIQKRGVQIILESHSEHLLTRLQRRIAEEELDPDAAALYFCDREATSQLRPLQIDLYGNITNWPKDFFGDELGERAAMMKAALKRRQAKVAA